MSAGVNLASVAVKDSILCHIDTEYHLLKWVAPRQRRLIAVPFFLEVAEGAFSS